MKSFISVEFLLLKACFSCYSKYVEEEEASIENLEQKLDRTLKLCIVSKFGSDSKK